MARPKTKRNKPSSVITSTVNVEKTPASASTAKKKKQQQQIARPSPTVNRPALRGGGRRKAAAKKPTEAKKPRGRPRFVANADAAETAEPIVTHNVFNREKLKRILKCLADQQQEQQKMSTSKGRVIEEASTLAAPTDIFNRDKLTKIKIGLLKQTPTSQQKADQAGDYDDDSDCCVVFSGPRSTQIPAKKKTYRLRTSPASSNNNNGETTTSGSSSKIFVNEKLKKILNGLHAATGRKLLGDPEVDVERMRKVVTYAGNGRPIGSTNNRRKRDPSGSDDDESPPAVAAKKSLVDKRKLNVKVEEPETEPETDPNVLTAAISLKERMVARLSAARFRYINEMLYTSSGADALQLFKDDPEAYNVYHLGYKNQLSIWPFNPLDMIIKDIKNMPISKVVADFGCGDAKLAQSVANKVHSFDLVALNERVVACNMDKVPLDNASVDVGVFCLSLMGINLTDYILEANRVLKLNGLLKIAEVQSRFSNVRKFQEQLEKYGFKFLKRNATYKMFVLMDFKKIGVCDKSEKKLPQINLQPCVYKKR